MGVGCSRARARPAITAAVCVAAGWLIAAPGHAAPTVANESAIKAQFFERFTRFIDWPESALAKGAPFVVCLVGGNQLATEIERRMARTTVKGVPTQVRRLPAAQAPDPGGCHAVYISPATRPQLPALLARTRGRPILTVADTEGFASAGRADQHVRRGPLRPLRDQRPGAAGQRVEGQQQAAASGADGGRPGAVTTE